MVIVDLKADLLILTLSYSENYVWACAIMPGHETNECVHTQEYAYIRRRGLTKRILCSSAHANARISTDEMYFLC